jgi:hypothetical protein
MNAEPGRSASFDAIDFVDKAVETASQPVDRVARAKLFKIIFVMLAAGFQAIWVAFLVWLVVHAIF